MNKRTAKRQGTEAANGAGAELAEVRAPLVAGMTATRTRRQTHGSRVLSAGRVRSAVRGKANGSEA